MSESNQTEQTRSPLIYVGLILAVILLIAGLFLPPISLGERLFGTGEPETTTAQQPTQAPTADTASETADETASSEEESMAEVVSNIPGKFDVTFAGDGGLQVDTGDLSGFAALPNGLDAQGDVFTLDFDGAAPTGSVAVNIPADAGSASTLDMFGWDGSTWRFMASSQEGGTLVSAESALPEAITLAQNESAENIGLGIEVLPSRDVPGALFSLINEVSVGTLTLGMDGMLLGEAALIQPGDYAEYLRTTNTGVVVDTPSLSTLLTDDQIRADHITELGNRAFDGGFAGINLDYQGAPEFQRDAFTQFVRELDAELSSRDLNLAVTLAHPATINDMLNSEGQDWAAIGKIADVVYARMPLNPTAYGDGGEAEQFITWATRHVNRDKLTLVYSANALDQVGAFFEEVPNEAALLNFGQLQLMSGGETIQVGEGIEMGLSGTAGALEWDGNGATYKYAYDFSGQEHTVWLANEGALAYRMRFVDRYNVRGVMVTGMSGISDAGGYAQALESLNGTVEAPAPSAAAIVWTVMDDAGNIVASTTGSDAFTFGWENADIPGDYSFNANFALGNNEVPLGTYAFNVAAPTDETAADTEASEAVASEGGDNSAETPAEEETADTASEDVATDEDAAAEDSNSTGNVVAVVSDNSTDGTLTIETNYRNGPGFAYSVVDILPNNAPVEILGRDSTGQWFNVSPVDDDSNGWVFAQLVSVTPGFDLTSVPTIGTASETVASVPQQPAAQQPAPVAQVTSTPTPWPTRPGPSPTPLPTGPWFTATPTSSPTPIPVPPTATPQPTRVPPTPTPTIVWPTNTPVPQIPAGVGGGFELGGQTHHFGSPGLMSDIGMNWVKFQHKWGSSDSPNAVADRISNAQAAGFKVLLSMPGQNTYPSSIDFAGYINFLRGVASLNPAPDAIEVWNEMNIDFEWPAGQINPAQYVNSMLKPAYQAIKAANPNIIVISGAPAPTGFDNNTNAWADDRYMRGVAQAGGGSFMDCIGVHYNAGATSPSQSSGHPADGGGQHYSWYYWPTINMYFNTFGGSRRVCITEVGYLSGEDFGGLPQNFNWADGTSVGEHAQWLGEAVTLGRQNSGKIRMMIIFNVDFTHFDPNGDPQAGYALIRPNGQCPACGPIRSAMGR